MVENHLKTYSVHKCFTYLRVTLFKLERLLQVASMWLWPRDFNRCRPFRFGMSNAFRKRLSHQASPSSGVPGALRSAYPSLSVQWLSSSKLVRVPKPTTINQFLTWSIYWIFFSERNQGRASGRDGKFSCLLSTLNLLISNELLSFFQRGPLCEFLTSSGPPFERGLTKPIFA